MVNDEKNYKPKELDDLTGEGLAKAFANVQLPAPELGQLLMQHLSPAEEHFDVQSKAYWIQVADHMGPDWIAALRRVAAFMQKVESF